MPLDSDFKQLRSIQIRPAWIVNTRPDCIFEISQLAQITGEMFPKDSSSEIRRLNRATRYAIDNRLAVLTQRLDKNSLRITGFSDSSLANNHDLSTQCGHIVLLGDLSDKVIPISFKSYKSRRVFRSLMAGEFISFSDISDIAIELSQDISVLVDKKIPFPLFTDKKSLLDVILKSSRTYKQHMMLEIAATREDSGDELIFNIGFVRSRKNLADGLIKHMNYVALLGVAYSGTCYLVPDQWLIRSTTEHY